MRIAIMQPYFIPYAGYFRLFQSTDLFVVYDCVQFMRRGYVHRNQLPNSAGELSWMTLPLNKAPIDVKISDLTFAEDAVTRMQEQLRKFPIFSKDNYAKSEFNQLILDFSVPPTLYITKILQLTCRLLELPCKIIQSSELNLPKELKGQKRILAIAKHFNAKAYINAPGGRGLYDEASFKHQGLQLQFLQPYLGPKESILSRLFSEEWQEIKKEIQAQSMEI